MSYRAFESSESFIRVDSDILRCQAFQGLSTAAQVLLIEFIGKYRTVRALWMSFTWSKRSNRRIGRNAFLRAMGELTAAGFLERRHEIGQRAVYAESSEWRLTIGKQNETRLESKPERFGNGTGSGPEGKPVPVPDTDRTGSKAEPDRSGDQTALLDQREEKVLDERCDGSAIEKVDLLKLSGLVREACNEPNVLRPRANGIGKHSTTRTEQI